MIRRRFAPAVLAGMLVALALLPGLARAQTDLSALGESSDTPRDGPYVIAVFGDSLAQGIWEAIYRKLQRGPDFEILRQTRPATGITRWDVYDWSEALTAFLDETRIDAAIVALGLNDMQALHQPDGSFFPFRTEAWDDGFQQRVEDMMAALQERDIATFWLGLPVMRSQGYSDNIRHLNSIFAASADQRGVTFIPLWDVVAGADGGYASHLPDLRGRTRAMRDNDGIHFTMSGYELLGSHILARMADQVPLPLEGR